MSNGISRDDWALTHHGVKGMKWGVRKVRQAIGRTVGRARASIKTRRTTAKAKNVAAKKRNSENSGTINVSDYSTSELRSVVERLELENRYMRASSERVKMERGSRKVDSALKTIGTAATAAENVTKIITNVDKIRKNFSKKSSNNETT